MNPWLSPLTLLLLAVVILVIAAVFKRKWWKAIAAMLIAVALLLMTPLFANALLRAVESRIPEQVAGCERPQGIVLLAGGLQRPAADPDDFGALTFGSLERAFGWVRQPSGERMPLLIAGGGPYTPAEADVLGNLLQRLGVDRSGLLHETQSRTTWQSAEQVRELLPREVTLIALASSAEHLSRAALAFHRVGFDVCPVVVASNYVDAEGVGALLPQSSALRKSERALYEIVGELWYRVRIAWNQGFVR